MVSRFNFFFLVLVIIQFLSALFLSWVLLSKVDFFYGTWHDHGGIGENISVFGPENRYKKDFNLTTRKERLRLFNEIVKAIHSKGEGLELITYHYPNGKPVDRLLRQPEVVHLQDVADLVSLVSVIGYISCFLLVAMVVIARWKKWQIGRPWRYHLGGLALLGVGIGLVLLIGAEAVFNQLHIWVFPKEHQWFFYYQDSLMSTMMKAPVLFAYIAAVLLVLGLVIHVVLAWGTQVVLKHNTSRE